MSSSLLHYIGRRLLQLIPIVLLIVLVTYILLRLAPGDMADVMAGESGSATPEYMAQLRSQFSLDLPASTVFLNYLRNLLHLDLGFSFRNGMPVADLIADRVGPTLVLMLSSITIAAVGGITLGYCRHAIAAAGSMKPFQPSPPSVSPRPSSGPACCSSWCSRSTCAGCPRLA
ncbi:ABC transporter permease [Herbaspirillum frisingense]|uniref:ABC transporter permease n=1 Tax=Herbaspirillum frisingense TaxID=92645 RepID=UPI0030B7FF7C